MAEVFEIADQKWRGIGPIPQSGLRLRQEYAAFDADRVFDLGEITVDEPAECISAQVLQGLKKPTDCPAFGMRCTPENPLGAPMVSSEGACAVAGVGCAAAVPLMPSIPTTMTEETRRAVRLRTMPDLPGSSRRRRPVMTTVRLAFSIDNGVTEGGWGRGGDARQRHPPWSDPRIGRRVERRIVPVRRRPWVERYSGRPTRSMAISKGVSAAGPGSGADRRVGRSPLCPISPERPPPC